MLNVLVIFIATIALMLPAGSQAKTNSLIFNNDSLYISHLTNPNNLLWRNSRQEFSLLFAHEADPRDHLLIVDNEFLSSTATLNLGHTLSPKMAFIGADYVDSNVFALGLGAIYHIPGNNNHRYNALIEIFLAPRLMTVGDGRYFGSVKLQFNYPLPENTEFNFGYRQIMIKLENGYKDPLEQGLYFGLSTHY